MNPFDDFAFRSDITYRVQWIEFTQGSHVHRVRDNEGYRVFRRQGWRPRTVGASRLFDGVVDSAIVAEIPFAEFQLRRPAPPQSIPPRSGR